MRLPALPSRIVLFAVITAAGCQRAASPPEVGSPQPVRAVDAASDTKAGATADPPAADDGVTVEQLDFDGIERLVASHKGQVVVMDAWSLSCPPCVHEFPKFVALAKRYPAAQLACISLSFDYDGIGQPADKLPRVEAFLRKQQAKFDNVLASEEADVLYPKFHLYSVPAVFVYDKLGKLRKRFDNQQARTEAETFTYDDVERLVVELLAEQPNSPSKEGAEGAENAAAPG